MEVSCATAPAQLGQACSLLCLAGLGLLHAFPTAPGQAGNKWVLCGDISTKSRVTSLLLEISRFPKEGKVATGQSCKDLGSEDNLMPLLMGCIFYTDDSESTE